MFFPAITGIVFRENALVSPLIDNVNIAQKTSSAIIEISIGVLMTYLLYQRKGGLKDTDNMLSRLIVFALTRGLVLSVTQIAYTAVFFGYPEKLYWVIFHFSLSKLASNSVLASLNVREIVRGQSTPGASGGSSDRSRRIGGPQNSGRGLLVNSRSYGDTSLNNISLQNSEVQYGMNMKPSTQYITPLDGHNDVAVEAFPMKTMQSGTGDHKVHPFASPV